MGLIISRFRRKKTTVQILENLENNIKSIEKDGQCKEETRKRVIGYMMAYSVGFYVLFAVLYYYMYAGKSAHWVNSLFYASPLLLLPILVIFLRSGISHYYNWTLTKNRVKLNKMKEEKKKLLEEVMNTETYKVAKEILDKFGGLPDQSKALKPFVPTTNVPGNRTPPSATPGQLRQRQLALATSTPINHNMPQLTFSTPGAYNGPRLKSDQLPRPLLDSNRSALDKVVDYLLKDGPNHRMALVCTQCFSHNGMAMAEEFEFVSYVCAYCGKLNPARKQRPAAPLLSPSILNTPAQRTAISRGLGPTGSSALARTGAGAGDDSSAPSSDSDDEPKVQNKNLSRELGSDGEPGRPPSPIEEAPKSDMQKKEE